MHHLKHAAALLSALVAGIAVLSPFLLVLRNCSGVGSFDPLAVLVEGGSLAMPFALLAHRYFRARRASENFVGLSVVTIAAAAVALFALGRSLELLRFHPCSSDPWSPLFQLFAGEVFMVWPWIGISSLRVADARKIVPPPQERAACTETARPLPEKSPTLPSA